MKKTTLLLAALLLAFSAHAAPAPADDDDEDDVDPVAHLTQMYLMFAEPEACAQLYPELRKDVDSFRKGVASRVKGSAATGKEWQLGDEQQKEIAGCLAKPAALSKAQCGKLIGNLSAPPKETADMAVLQKHYFEMQQLLAAGRPMIGACADRTEKDLRKKYGPRK